MTLRDIWGRPLFVREAPDTTGGAVPPVPGTGEAGPGDPSAPTPSGATVPVADQDPPGPIPYSRFQEVNSQRRDLVERYEPYRELEESGYDAANLQRLALWEQEYMSDPVETWLRQASDIEGLPEQVKAAIAAVGESAASTQGTPPAEAGSPAQPSADDPNEELRQQVAELQAERDARTSKEQADAVSEFYDGLVGAWKQLDEAQGIITPEGSIHAYLATSSVNATSAEEILRNGREAFIADRDELLKATIVPPGTGTTVPRSVPGSGVASAPPVRPRTLQEAKRAAEADPMFANQS